jgi:hypothetical protein
MSIHIVDFGWRGGKLGAIRDSDLKRKSIVSIDRQNEINRMLDYYDWFLKSQHVFSIGHDLSQLKRVERVSSSFGKKAVSKFINGTYVIASKLGFPSVSLRKDILKNKTKAAIKVFRKSSGLEENSRIDLALLDRLGLQIGYNDLLLD